MLKIDTYFDKTTWAKMKTFADGKETPFVMINLDSIKKKYEDLAKNFPMSKIYYAVKANPAPEIITLLHNLGAYFDIASIYELERVLSLGVEPEKISYGNTIKKAKDIRTFYEKGVRMFATDSEEDLRNIAREAPNSRVYVRILTEGGETSDWPLSRKFGCHTEMAVELMILARDLQLEPYGISFHVGSQQRDIGVWDGALSKVEFVSYRLKQEGIKLQMINLGGGFPAKYLQKTHKLSTYAKQILKFLKDDFGRDLKDLPELILEPGRAMVAEAGVIVTEVILVSRKARNDLYRWVFTDIGKFSGMIETLDEAIRYPLYTEKEGKEGNESEEVIIAGPTCDSMDILYEHHKYSLPLSLSQGDRLYWFATGAYTTSYSAIEFNGFPPLKAYYL